MRTIKQGAALWAVAGALLLAWFAFAAGVNAGTDNEVRDAIEQQEKVEHFYRVVAGELSGQEPGPANRLARDIRDLPNESLTGFTGDSNRYGGITSELGFDPFNGVDCSECGPLDREVIEDTQAIKSGDLNEVLERLESEIPDPSELAGPPTLLWFLWFFSLPIAAGAMMLRKRRSEEDKYREFTEERKLLTRIRDAKNELPPGHKEWLELDQLADSIQEQIDARVSYRKSKTQRMKLDALTEEATSTLDDIAAGNRTLD